MRWMPTKSCFGYENKKGWQSLQINTLHRSCLGMEKFMISLILLIVGALVLVLKLFFNIPWLETYALSLYAAAFMVKYIEDYFQQKKLYKEMFDTLHNQASILCCMDKIHKEIFALDLPEDIQSKIELIFEENLEELNDDYK